MKTRILTILLLSTLGMLIAACGTLEVGVEPDTTPPSPEATSIPATPTGVPDIDATETPPSAGEPTVEADIDQSVTITGTAAALSLGSPSGRVSLVPDSEDILPVNEYGLVFVEISEWTSISSADGSIYLREDLSRGAHMRITGLVEDDVLIADEVIVLSPGVPRPEDNPAYTDVTGRVTPIPEQPPTDSAIRLFEVDSASTIADPGETITLRWAFDGESGAICQHVVPQPRTQTCFQDLPASGEMAVVVPEEARGAIGFTLYVEVPPGEVEQNMIILPLTAERGCEHEWFFTIAENRYKPLLECPNTAPIEIRLQAQVFERGFMVRVDDPGLGDEPGLFTVVPHEEPGVYSWGFQPVVDTWTQGMEETDASLTPPEGFYQPSRGFGMLWRGEIAHYPMGGVEYLDGLTVLGWATSPVIQYDSVYQCYESTHGRLGSCLMRGPNGEIFSVQISQ